MGVTRGRTRLVWAIVTFVIGAAPLVTAFAVDPDLDSPVAAVATGDDVESMFVLRLRGIAVLGTLVAASLYLLASGRARPGAGAVCGAGLVLAATPVISGIFGLEPRLRGTLLVQPALFFLLFLLPSLAATRLARWVRWIVLFYVYASLLAVVLAPAQVLQTTYTEGWIPGLRYRLHGLGVHANGLAPFTVVYFLMRWFVDKRARGVTRHDLVALLVLVLTQSKMAWATFALTGALAIGQNRRLSFPWARWLVVAFTILMAVFMTDLSDSVGFVGKAVGILPIANQSQAYTLTGRTQVWRETLYLWEQSPWFGYGPGLWDLEMQERYRDVLGWAPPAAHSQFYQTLGESGLIGIGGLAIYLGALVGLSLSLGRTHPVTTSLVVLIIARGITEPTLSANLDGAFVVHFWAVAFLVLAWRSRRRARERAAR